MLNIINQSKKATKIFIATLLGLTIILTSSFLDVSAAELNSSAIFQDVGKAYYNADFEYLDDEAPVYQSLTWEEAVYLFQQEGNYLILFGGSWCGNTTSVIDYINDAAKAAGVDTVYNLDFRLDGTDSETHIRETNTSEKKGADYNYLYGELVSRYLTNLNDWVEYTVDSESALTYTNAQGTEVTVPKVQVPFLFIYNKDNTVNNKGESEEGKTYPIVYGFEKMLYRDADGGDDLFSDKEKQDETTKVSDYTEQLNNAIFSHIGSSEGKVTLSDFTDADYIRLAYNEKSGETIFEEDDQINIRTLTYKQLDWLLQQDGDYLILFGGSWCGNTQAVIKIINDYAVSNDVIVYNFDTKLDGGYAKKNWEYSGDLHIRDSENEFAYLYVDLVNKYLKNIETEYTIESGNYISYESDVDGETEEVIANKLQVPYFFAYNKNSVNDDGHDTPILNYVEKMYVLDSTSEDYINNETNYADYTSSTFDVIKTYAQQRGITAVTDIAENVAVATATNVIADDSSNTSENDTEEISQAAGNTSESSENSNNSEKSDDGNIGKIIAVIIGVVVVAVLIVVVVVGKKKKSSEDGGCC